MRVFSILIVLIGLASVARAQDGISAVDRDAIRGVIEQQVEAFRADDGDRAFGFASPGIQQMFGSADNFMAMVRQGYEPVYRPRSVEFRELVAERGRLAQRVLFVGPDGVPVVAEYTMEQQPDGTWRIAGCMLLRSPELSA